jgi:hypothetical protein
MYATKEKIWLEIGKKGRNCALGQGECAFAPEEGAIGV